MTGRPLPWLWRIYIPATSEVVDYGVQHTRPFATPGEVARERMACHAWRVLVSPEPDLGLLAALACRAWRGSDVGRFGEAAGAEWMPAEVLVRRVA